MSDHTVHWGGSKKPILGIDFVVCVVFLCIKYKHMNKAENIFQ